MSSYHHTILQITMALCHHAVMLLCHHATMPSCHDVTISPCRHVTMPPYSHGNIMIMVVVLIHDITRYILQNIMPPCHDFTISSCKHVTYGESFHQGMTIMIDRDRWSQSSWWSINDHFCMMAINDPNNTGIVCQNHLKFGVLRVRIGDSYFAK